MPLPPHTLATHSFARAQVTPFEDAQVFVTLLHVPETQVASAVASLQTPV